MKHDEIKFTVLPSGLIKMETDEVGQANHLSADKFLALVQQLAGGETETTRKGKAHTHTHGQMTHTH